MEAQISPIRCVRLQGSPFVNLSVVTGLMPNTRLTLPFVSYGLTSLVSLYMGAGLVLNVGLQSGKHCDGTKAVRLPEKLL